MAFLLPEPLFCEAYSDIPGIFQAYTRAASHGVGRKEPPRTSLSSSIKHNSWQTILLNEQQQERNPIAVVVVGPPKVPL